MLEVKRSVTGLAASLSGLDASVAESPGIPRSPSQASRARRPRTVPDDGVTNPDIATSTLGRRACNVRRPS
jgi:hypothetical protein